MSMLCKLSDVKTLLNISAEDTTQDAKLTLLIKDASAMIESYCGYSFGRDTYTDEIQAENNRQLLQLNHFPLQSVTSVSVGGNDITDFKLFPEYSRWGRIYRGLGWGGKAYTRGFTHDIVSGVWDVKVTYTAGYYLPNDTDYVEGNSDSLPYDITSVCLKLVEQSYNFEVMGAKGLKGHTEGHITDTYSDDANIIGLSESAKKTLARYCYYGVA